VARTAGIDRFITIAPWPGGRCPLTLA